MVSWRSERLLAAGFPEELARRIACDPRYDLHAVLELVDRGCPAELAVRIVAPLEQRPPRC
jgi:hypothetical protein